MGPTFHEFMTSIRMGDSPILFYGLYDELIDKLIMSSIVMDKAKVMVAHPLPNLTPATVTKSKVWCVNIEKKTGSLSPHLLQNTWKTRQSSIYTCFSRCRNILRCTTILPFWFGCHSSYHQLLIESLYKGRIQWKWSS